MDKNQKTQYHDIILTDLQLHVTKPRKPRPWHNTIRKHIRNKKPGRFYSTNLKVRGDGGLSVIFPSIQKEVEEAERQGKKIRLFYPRKGLPIYAGRDLAGYLQARNRREKLDRKNYRKV